MRKPLLPPDLTLELPELLIETKDLTLSALFALYRGEPCWVLELLSLENIEGGPEVEQILNN